MVSISPRHMSAVSSSTMNPVDTTFNRPRPTLRSLGMIFGLSAPSTRCASSGSSIPSRRGTEKPQMSASSTPTVKPCAATAAARFTVTELLPTPPLPLATARILQVSGTSVAGAFSRAFQRALVITSLRSSLVISPQSIRTSRTPGCSATRVSMSFLICARSGQPPMVSFTCTSTKPLGCTVTPGTMPSVTMSAPNSGSMTDASRSSTSASVGSATGDVATGMIVRSCGVTMRRRRHVPPSPQEDIP